MKDYCGMRAGLSRFVAAGVAWSCFAALALAQGDRVVITNAPGYTILWDGNNGGFSSPEPGASAPDNSALAAKGATAFGSTAYLPGGIHDFPNVIDGYYGNSSSWISDFRIPDTNAFIGVAFGKSVMITNVAWSRDNGDDTERTPSAPYADRAVGTYTLQVTTVVNPDANTAEAGTTATGWVTIGSVTYKPGTDNLAFSAYLRHRFDVSAAGQPIPATGLRIKVSDGGMDLDEMEVNDPLDPNPPISSFITINAAPGYTIDWNGNEGKFFQTNSPAPAPKNRALASQGTTAFASSEYGHGVHFATNVIDGLYGNTRSWISDFAQPDTNAYVGVNFHGTVSMKSIAWGRDNGDSTDCCGGQLQDRWQGTYTLQVTQVAAPGTDTPDTGDPTTGWSTAGTVTYKAAGPPFTPYLRHLYTVSQGGAPISATGMRLKVSDGSTDIDEIEVNPNAASQALADGLIVLTPQSNYSLTWDGNDGEFFSPTAGASAPVNDALAANGSTAFGSGQLFPNGGIHDIDNVIDGLYGNSHSWIPGTQEADPNVNTADGAFIGVKFAKTVAISNIAWGRDNGNSAGDCCGGQLTDRWQGTYTLQITRVSAPGLTTTETGDASTGWVTIGTVEYTGQAPPDFNPWLRHRYEVAGSDGKPIPATGLRIKVSSNDTDIDEIEVNPSNVPPPPLVITNGKNYSITWDTNDGLFTDTNAPARAPANLAMASNGTVAFGSSEYGHGVHYITNIIDGLYGNKHSWISDFDKPDTNAFVGVAFGRAVPIRSIAWGRDNGDNTEGPANPNTDRARGLYTLQVTSVSNAGVNTPETEDPATGWVTLGTIDFRNESSFFHAYSRHRFDVSSNGIPVSATALRIKVANNGTAIDELEVNPQENISIKSAPGYTIGWDGNDGDFNSPDTGAAPPDNAALASKGVTAFGSSELDFGGIHLIAHINDGLYGNSHSWISDRGVGGGSDTNLFVGLNFGKTMVMSNLAWSRDNGDTTEGACGGTCTDRSQGIYTLQVSTVINPGVDTPETGDAATGWATIGTVSYRGEDAGFHPWLRHRFDVATTNGTGIQATGLRITVSDPNTDIDEIEVNTAAPVQAPSLAIIRRPTGLLISWTGPGILQTTDKVLGPWTDVTGAASPYTVTVTDQQRFYRLQR